MSDDCKVCRRIYDLMSDGYRRPSDKTLRRRPLKKSSDISWLSKISNFFFVVCLHALSHPRAPVVGSVLDHTHDMDG